MSRNSIHRDEECTRRQRIPLRRDRVGALILGMFLVSVMTLCGATLTVTNTADNGPGSLRQAILDANANPGLDTVAFNIPGAGVHTISPTNLLPAISEPIIIDGYTQPGASPNTLTNGDDAVLLIELDGSGVILNFGLIVGLRIDSGSSLIRGLVVNRFTYGILLTTYGTNVLTGNFIGTDPSGLLPRPNGIGINCSSYPLNHIGGLAPADRNLISGNLSGIVVDTSLVLNENFVQGNFIGTDKTGKVPMGNRLPLELPIWGTNWVVGGTLPGAGNVISGNETGVELSGYATQFKGNLIGVGSDGISRVGNTNVGVTIPSGFAQVGGTEAGAGNVIAFNGGDGVQVWTDGNAILGNSIFANGGLGIDDLEANNLQASPTLTSAIIDTETALSGTLTNSFSPNYRLEVFASRTPGQRASGEGEVFLGSADVVTDFDGKAIFTVEIGKRDFNHPWITATATDADGNTSEFSAAVLVQSTAAPIIQWPPTNQIGRAASNATFSVVASGLGPLAYQWRFQGTVIQGATNATLLLTNIQLADDGPYTVIVSNALGWVESNPVTLTVYERPVIVQQPQDRTAVQGDNVAFAVVAVGGPPPLKYIWRFNNQSIAGETNPVLVLNNVQSTNAGGYKVGISTLGGTALSANAVLAVLPDSDGDHMPDAWEVANNLNPNDPSDASLDPDGDGMTNLQEYVAGTDPRSAQSYLKVDQISFGAGGAQISFLAVSNRAYRLLYKRSLDDPAWLKVADQPPRTTNSVGLISDSIEPEQRFYRLEITP